MSVGTWEPPGQKRTNIELSLIRRFLSFAESVDFEHNLDDAGLRGAGLEVGEVDAVLHAHRLHVLHQPRGLAR